jgi:hypothetical protein
MVIFHSYVSLPEGSFFCVPKWPFTTWVSPKFGGQINQQFLLLEQTRFQGSQSLWCTHKRHHTSLELFLGHLHIFWGSAWSQLNLQSFPWVQTGTSAPYVSGGCGPSPCESTPAWQSWTQHQLGGFSPSEWGTPNWWPRLAKGQNSVQQPAYIAIIEL